MTAGREMPICSRSFNLLKWLLQATSHFPRVHRHNVTRRLLDAAFGLYHQSGHASRHSG